MHLPLHTSPRIISTLPRNGATRAAVAASSPTVLTRKALAAIKGRTVPQSYFSRSATEVEFSRSATVVEVSRRRIVVEYSRSTVVGRSTVVVGKSCSYSIFDVVVIFCGLSSIIREVDLVDRRISGVT